jgi:glycosyltransferase involved in cell wall biosynthesis/tetratricopeptide (TPR) repeat protein
MEPVMQFLAAIDGFDKLQGWCRERGLHPQDQACKIADYFPSRTTKLIQEIHRLQKSKGANEACLGNPWLPEALEGALMAKHDRRKLRRTERAKQLPAVEPRVIGLLRVRNEAHIIRDTLDHMGGFCDGGVYVYDDLSSDATLEICRAHPAVRDVVVGEFWDGNRGRANYTNRAAVLARGKRDARPQDWFVYMDADERIDFNWSTLLSLPNDVLGIRMKLFDYYITPEDVEKNYQDRRYLGPEYRRLLMTFRNLPTLRYWLPGTREVDLGVEGRVLEAGFVKHYGKAISLKQWEENCTYYSQYFPHFSAKWHARRSKAVHTRSDFNRELITWAEKETRGVPLTGEIEAAAAQNYSCENANRLRILLTNHQLLDFTGSELFTYTIAHYLKRAGHEVVVYSRYVDKIGRMLVSLGIRVVQSLEEIAGESFDVAHVHHNINAMEIRHQFPKLPMVMLSHGVLPFIEQPPAVDLHIGRYLAVSEEVRDHWIEKGIDAERISIFRNVVDSQIFSPVGRIRSRPQRALIVSSRLDEAHERIIREALFSLGMEGQFVGSRFGEADPSLLPHMMNEADLVFSLGRGAIEAMLCGRIPIVFDYLGGDGMVTPDNLDELMKCNFSGRKYRKEYTAPELVDEIRRYRQENGERLRAAAQERFSADARIQDLVAIYREAISQGVRPLDPGEDEKLVAFINTIRETRNYSWNQLIRRCDRDLLELSVSRIPPPAVCGGAPEVERAIQNLRDQLWLEPTNSQIHNQMGILYYSLGRKEEALDHFRAALELDPQNARAGKNLALLSVEMWPEWMEKQRRQDRRIEDLEARMAAQPQCTELELAAMRDALYFEMMKTLAERMKRLGMREVMVYGAGIAGRALARASAAAGIKVRCFVDQKKSLWGARIEEVKVFSLPQAMRKNLHIYAIGSFSFVSEIKRDIRRAYAATDVQPRILTAI